MQYNVLDSNYIRTKVVMKKTLMGVFKMKVKQLIKELQKLDQEFDVICYTEDEEFLPEKHGFRIFEINDVTTTEGEKVRDESNMPSIKFGKSDYSKKHIVLNITSDF
jgi:hypothetical protein